MNLIDVHKQFATDEQCLDYLEKMRWPEGVRCVTCGNNKVSTITRQAKSKNKRTRLYQCLEPTCKQQFSATAGTIFHDSHLPLRTWFLATALVCNAKKGISALQLQRDLGLGSYRTAWYLYHRIRKAMEETGGPKLKGVVEVDETYVGGRKKFARGPRDGKDIVVGVRQRGGPLRFVHTKDTKADTLYQIVENHVSKDVELIMTDENPSYNFDLTQYRGKHRRIKHKDRVYVRGNVHTNTIENAFSLLKRGIFGNFHRVSIKHLQQYLNEFSYRFNRRQIVDLVEQTIARLTGSGAMPYRALVGKP